jgi:putative transposase
MENIKSQYLHSTYEKSIMERTIEYVKDRTKSFDDFTLLVLRGRKDANYIAYKLVMFAEDIHNKLIQNEMMFLR